MAAGKIKITGRSIQIALGILWLFDGALQLQPKMFTGAFATQVIEPAAQGQPHFVSAPMLLCVHLFLLHPALFNALLALTQLSLGVLILFKPTARLGILLSIAWGLFVWSIGEGFSGLFSGQTMLLMGLPGAALLYVILSIAVLPEHNKVTNRQPRIAFWLAIVWVVVWLVGGSFQLLPRQGDVASVGSMITANASGAPGWISSLDDSVGGWLVRHGSSTVDSVNPATKMDMLLPAKTVKTKLDPGYMYVLLFWVVSLAIGLGVLKSGKVRTIAVLAGMTLSVCFWILGQDMGGYYTGVMTDPNSGPLFVLLGIAILSCTNLDEQLAKLGQKVENILIGNQVTDNPAPTIEPATET